MNVEHAATCVAFLTSMTSGWNDDATEQLVYEFARLDDPDALADAVHKIARTWTSNGRVPLGVIMDAYQHELRLADEALQQQLAAKQIRCDGSGWLTHHDDDGEASEWPCATCNPALARIWADPELKRRWRQGQATHRILGFDDRDELVAKLGRSRCLPDEGEDCIDQRRGMAVAVAAYRNHYDRTPPKGLTAMIAAATRGTR